MAPGELDLQASHLLGEALDGPFRVYHGRGLKPPVAILSGVDELLKRSLPPAKACLATVQRIPSGAS